MHVLPRHAAVASTLLSSFLAGPTTAQQSLARFDAPVVQVSPSDPPFRRLFDFDADGDVDAFGTRGNLEGTKYELALFRNDGGGVLEKVWNPTYTEAIQKGGVPMQVEVGDLDGDGKDDAVVATKGGFELFRSNGSGLLRSLIPLSEEVLAFAVGDFDGNGIDDVAAAGPTNLFLRTFAPPISITVSTHGNPSPVALRAIEANGDAHLDLLLVVPGRLYFHAGDGTGSFTPLANVTHAFPAGMVDVGDVDGDLDADVVVFDDVGMQSYQVLRRTGPAAWALEAVATGGPAEFLRDADGDGDLDGVCCGGGGGGNSTFPVNTGPSTFQISFNDGTGAFAPAFQIPSLGSPQIAGVADVDGDGDLDLVAGRVVYYARGALAPLADQGGPDLPPCSERDVCDFDGDGDPDLGLSLDSVWVNDGSGRFAEAAPAMPEAPAGTRFHGPGYPGDFDGDGDVDLLVEHRHAKQPLHAVLGRQRTPIGGLLGMRLLANDGTGVFTDAGLASAPGITFSLGSLAADASLAADLNLDGALDLVTRTQGKPARSRFWHNTGSGQFLGPYELLDMRVEHVEDLDEDGIPDLLASEDYPTYGTWKLEVWSGFLFSGGTTGWVRMPELMPDLPFDSTSSPIGSGDLLVDGHTDFAFSRRYPGFDGQAHYLYDLAPYGGTGYGANVSLPSTIGLRIDARVAIGDLNGDGADDALIGPHWEPVATCYVALKRLPTGNQFDSVRQLLEPGPLVDVDGDGDLDVIGTRVVFNRTLN